jgi:hypothetical protein
MPSRKKPTLLAQDKPRTLGGSGRSWPVRPYAPEPGSTKHQVMFRAPAGDGFGPLSGRPRTPTCRPRFSRANA